MFPNKRYITMGIKHIIPYPLQQVMWDLIDNLCQESENIDYLQVFEFEDVDYDREKAVLIHRQEVPIYEKRYLIFLPHYVLKKIHNKKIFIIDAKDYCTMLFSYEY